MNVKSGKQFVAKLHLYIGLWLGGVFVVLGLTGTAIAWLPELDAALNPALLQSVPRYAGAPFQVTSRTVQEVVERLSGDTAYGRPAQLNTPADGHDVYVAYYRVPPAAGAGPATQTRLRQVMLDADTLQVKGEREWGSYGLSRPLLMPTLFHLHRYLLSGEVGKILTGITGVALLALAFSGLVLWWPRPNWQALRRALRISYGGSWPRLHYSLHKTSGFFAAPVLAVLAFSGIYMNLPQMVLPVVGMLAELSPGDKVSNAAPGAHITPGAAMAAAQALYPNGRVSRIALPAQAGLPYEIRVRQPDEVAKGDGATRVTLDAVSGKLLRVRDPLLAPGGERFLGWQYPLHSGQAFGAPGRAFISVFGLLPLGFFLTGVLIWMKRRPAARKR
ncbi:PepSY-associated TM helix domain-containing protein [Janthinobacterium fluminis]|uniref:PepSY-associated TM helix domain-containing protein n=1 Tax=Janthinobacterium fluminis TaxID=2987524 RepID=A0ABT5K0T6_9BURK|nr:PepSY-associated TM helix domain-containing protein [Janthinobacterium fluminis]MDC8757916.1 PepSY-associated TM helix domain-containing protein [Janthinobacterium fluminis]